jgi:sec-independent protein translocase protein TatA
MVAVYGMGPTELLIIAGIVVLLFGASRLPKLGKSAGQGIRGFKDGLKEGAADEPDKALPEKTRKVEAEIVDDEDDDEAAEDSGD